MTQAETNRANNNNKRRRKRKSKGNKLVPKMVKSRTWKCLSQAFQRADIYPASGESGNSYLVCFRKPKDENGKVPDDFATFPKWVLKIQDHTVRLDQIQMLNLLRDTLIEYKPKCAIRVKKRYYTGVVTGFHGTVSDDPLYEKYKRNYYFMLSVTTDSTLPEKINKPVLLLQSKLLPKGRYQYGFCNKIDAAYNPCSDLQYLKAPSMTLYNGNGQCMAFDLTKGNPHQYCSFTTGS